MEDEKIESGQDANETVENSINHDTPEEEVVPQGQEQEEVVEDMPQPTEKPAVISLDTVLEMFNEINKKFDDKIAKDTHKNQLFDKMYTELQSLREDPYKKIMKPIFMDLIVFIDNMRSMVSKYDEFPSENDLLPLYQKLKREFNEVGNHIENLLYNYKIEPFRATLGDDFDPKTQQSRKITQIENDIENEKIIESLSPGYYWEDAILRKEGVHVGVKKV